MESLIMKKVKGITAIILCLATIVVLGISLINTLKDAEYSLAGRAVFVRDPDAEEDYEDETVCAAHYISEDGQVPCVVNLSFDEWEALPEEHSFEGYIYELADGRRIAFDHPASSREVNAAVHDLNADGNRRGFSIALALSLMAVSALLMTCYGRFFTDYEQIWFLSIMFLAGIISIIVPEEDVNGVKGIVIMALYLADTFLNILCELLIAKQSKWNFIVSVFVEITEIVICVVLAYRFATLATTLFFWLPIDIISFVNWHKHPDRQEEDLTRVRKLSGLTRVLILIGIVVWTVVVGYFISGLNIATDLFGGNRTLETFVIYFDACASAIGIVNGVLILLRYQEQWFAWIACSLLEAVINILSGQYVLLVLKAGYLTNSTYGYLKWRKYINTHEKEEQKLLSF